VGINAATKSAKWTRRPSLVVLTPLNFSANLSPPTSLRVSLLQLYHDRASIHIYRFLKVCITLVDYRRLVSSSHLSMASASSAKRLKPSRCSLPYTTSMPPSLFRRILGSSHSGEPLRIRLTAAGGVCPRHGEAQCRVVYAVSAEGNRVLAPHAVHLSRNFKSQQLPAATALVELGASAYDLHHVACGYLHTSTSRLAHTVSPLHPVCTLGNGLVQQLISPLPVSTSPAEAVSACIGSGRVASSPPPMTEMTRRSSALRIRYTASSQGTPSPPAPA